MPTLQTGDGVNLHYTDTGGHGRPLVLIHGWPLSGEAFAGNIPAFTEAGYRVVTYDRRGFGRSDKPADGYDYDTLAEDLAAVIDHLDLNEVVLLGFSMGGGEVARYLSRHGAEKVSAAVFSCSVAPALCITEDNPDGAMPLESFQELVDQFSADRDGMLEQFLTWFYSTPSGVQVDEPVRAASLEIARQSDPAAACATIITWASDLREDCAAINVPTLVIHGDGDLNVPLEKSSARMPQHIPGATLVVVEGGPHGFNVSHAKQWEAAILEFLNHA